MLSRHLHLDVLSHAPLDGFDGAFRVEDVLVTGRFADQYLPVFANADERGQHFPAFSVHNHGHYTIFHNGHFRVGRAQINTDDDFTHNLFALTSASRNVSSPHWKPLRSSAVTTPFSKSDLWSNSTTFIVWGSTGRPRVSKGRT